MAVPIRQHRFHQVDVFDSSPFSGNPVAVVHAADGLTDDEMATFTNWTNLSEATFLLPPIHADADYRVRIFYPGGELPFAGHPTLGTCRAWLAAGGTPQRPDRVIQECGAGLVPIRTDGETLSFAAPERQRTGPVDPALLADRLGLLGIAESDVVDASWVDNGPGWMAILLTSARSVMRVTAPAGTLRGFNVGVVGPHPAGSDVAIEVRAFFADGAGLIREDPVTGSLNASVAQWLLETGRLTAPYVAAQGAALGRAGRVHVSEADGEIWVGGRATVRMAGTVDV